MERNGPWGSTFVQIMITLHLHAECFDAGLVFSDYESVAELFYALYSEQHFIIVHIKQLATDHTKTDSNS